MASKDKLKVMLSLMRELNDGNIPTAKDYGITDMEFNDIVDACQDAGYIKNARIAKGGNQKIIKVFIDNAKLTVKGMEYLHDHSTAMQAYKGIKEIKDWLPW